MSSHGPMSAQYCPPNAGPASPASLSSSASPSSSATDPPQGEAPFADVSEQQRLMSDESDRCAEEDPRILLSPLRPHDC
ncbi:hypothetical protein FHG87_025765 [Trinorchestia longiramus]|nr:hypothetical protein FHG87_025765 [Trinorchestia longiramus]